MSSQTTDLNALYGAVFDPGADVREPEKARRQQTLFALNKYHGTLKAMMAAAEKKAPASYCLFNEFSYLWLVNAKGAILLALEETLESSDSETTYPAARSCKLISKDMKLGHPALLASQKGARIAGEIMFDLTSKPPGWIINNRSGRYGSAKIGRTRDHLVNVAKLFKKYDITVRPSFWAGA
ncbi:hypothetical protein IZ6_20890 [Terrihabitans soli]|uniref:Uncharacterized protein n=1 Tax=Terrihabitans soli TaxID=708113 RepID=A0A6S6QLR4_9HYPH|nr:hypothetical protein [Terrihabitans soli]BCJ91354.1 hypothetical protein IZ6_20890 [Terrihabitans soli]